MSFDVKKYMSLKIGIMLWRPTLIGLKVVTLTSNAVTMDCFHSTTTVLAILTGVVVWPWSVPDSYIERNTFICISNQKGKFQGIFRVFSIYKRNVIPSLNGKNKTVILCK